MMPIDPRLLALTQAAQNNTQPQQPLSQDLTAEARGPRNEDRTDAWSPRSSGMSSHANRHAVIQNMMEKEGPERGPTVGDTLLKPGTWRGAGLVGPGWTHPQTGETHSEGTILHSPSTGQMFQVKNGQLAPYSQVGGETPVTMEHAMSSGGLTKPQTAMPGIDERLDQYEQALAATDPMKAAELAMKRFEMNSKAYPIGGEGSSSEDAQEAQVKAENSARAKKADPLQTLIQQKLAALQPQQGG